MIMTFTRNTPVTSATIPKIPRCVHEPVTIAGGGGTVVRAVNLTDLFAREAVEGDPSWKILDQLVKDGIVQTITFAADPADLDVVDEANEV